MSKCSAVTKGGDVNGGSNGGGCGGCGGCEGSLICRFANWKFPKPHTCWRALLVSLLNMGRSNDN